MRRTDLITVLVATIGMLLGCCAGAQDNGDIATGIISTDRILPSDLDEQTIVVGDDIDMPLVISDGSQWSTPPGLFYAVDATPGLFVPTQPAPIDLAPCDDCIALADPQFVISPGPCGWGPFTWDADADACVANVSVMDLPDLPTVLRVRNECGYLFDITIPSCPK